MSRHAWMVAGALITMGGLMVGCTDSETGSSTTAATSDIQAMVTDSTADHAQAATCFTEFRACVDAAADADARLACKTTLDACLPDRPDRPAPAEADMCGPPPGGPRGERPDGPPPGDLPPPPPGAPPPGERPDGPPPGDLPPPPDGVAAGGDGGVRPPRPPRHCGFGGPAGRACRDALTSCLAAEGADQAACLETAHECVHAAIAANFAARCAEHLARCQACAPDATLCEPIAARCAAGVPMPEATPVETATE